MLYQLLAEKAAQFSNNRAVIGDHRTLSYLDLYTEATKTAAYLQSLGLQPGESILLGIPPSPELHAALFGAAALGLTSVTLLPSGKISNHVADAQPAAAMGPSAFLSAASKRCPSLRHLVEWRRESGLQIANPDKPFVRTKVFGGENIIAVSSSGTTGEPKLFFRSAQVVVERSALRAAVHGIRADDILLATRPYSSSVAIGNQVIIPVIAGSAIVIPESVERFKIAESIGAAHVSVLLASPFFYELLGSIPKSHLCDLSSIRLCVSGGAPLSRHVARVFEERFGLTILQWYSGSHINPAFLYNDGAPADSVGRIDGIFPARILGEEHEILGPDEIGEIVFHLHSMPEKWKKSFETNPHLSGQYLHTGDLGRIDAAGNIYFVGRKSALIKVGGNRVAPAEVEDVLRRHPVVREALVFATPTANADEILEAVVEASGDIGERDLLKYCAQHLDPFKCPRRITIKANLPRTEQGKVSRRMFAARGT
jgi:long-chain acyl-CoA synthetase